MQHSLTSAALSLVGAFVLSAGLHAPVAIAAVPDVKGTVKVDGSSTVFPISEAVAEEFQKQFKNVNVTVAVSGTGGGFKKFIAGELDVVDASRPIKQAELEACEKAGISFVELPIAYDALSVVVNPKNTWATSLTVKELAKIWAPEAQGKVMKWSDVRTGFPDKPIQLFGPGVDSGTFDYFTEAIVGKEDASRGDYTSSEDDNVLVTGVAGNEGGLGFFGVAYYEGNKDKLKALPIDDEKAENGAGPQLPTTENVLAGKYQPLSRPLLVYVRKDSLDKPEVREFVNFYLDNAKTLAPDVGYISLPETATALAKERFEKKVIGSIFGGKGSQVGMTIEQLLKTEKGS
jgi:phosphate transport system substrate-binding protein